MTIKTVPVGSEGWEFQPCRSEVIFYSQFDKRKWAKLSVAGKEHFVQFYIGIDDDVSGLDNRVLSASEVYAGKSFALKTNAFKADIQVAKAVVGSDPDPVKPYPSVFKELVLNVRVQQLSSRH